MLNASRHHRKNRFALVGFNRFDVDRAQRLAASQEKSRCVGSYCGYLSASAQRLAASQEKSHGPDSGTTAEKAVLNASRHHRKNRHSRGVAYVRRNRVLNASRHHRKNRSSRVRQATSLAQGCSTPRGITGKIAILTEIVTTHSEVLNASRHHRKNRPSAATPLGVAMMCSTPRGITGKIAFGATRAISLSSCAQRLAASQEKSQYRQKHKRKPCDVLNASRHHRKNRDEAEAFGGIVKACSTPRGITGKIACRCRSAWRNISVVLNASRHHRKNRFWLSFQLVQA